MCQFVQLHMKSFMHSSGPKMRPHISLLVKDKLLHLFLIVTTYSITAEIEH